MQFKKIAAFLLGIVFVFSVCASAFAAGTTLTVGSVSAAAGDEASVPISISANTGFAAMTLTVKYDKSALSYVDYDKGILTDYTVKNHPKSGTVRIVNCEDGNLTKDGTLITLNFKVNKGVADGNYPVTLVFSDGDICDWDLNYITPVIISGNVAVGNTAVSSATFESALSQAEATTESHEKDEQSVSESSTEKSSKSEIASNTSSTKNAKKSKSSTKKSATSKKSILKVILAVSAVIILAVLSAVIFKNKLFRREDI